MFEKDIIQVKFVRLFFILVLSGVFAFLAYDLYQKQYNEYTYLSFKPLNASTAVIIPDLDRLLDKINASEELGFPNLNTNLAQGLQELLNANRRPYSEVLGKSCFISWNTEEFIIAFDNPDLSYDDVVNLLQEQFGSAASVKEGMLHINEQNYYAAQHGSYTIFGNKPIETHHVEADQSEKYRIGNADFVLLKDSSLVERHVMDKHRHFKVWTSIEKEVRGHPVNPSLLIQKVPKDFDQINFYGSSRFGEDKYTFFDSPSEEEYSWVNNGLLIIRKDSFELMIAQQNDERDLRLMLEEQTLETKNDSGQIDYFSLRSFKIMPFTGDFQWQKSIPALNDTLRYYTEYENLNILSNSIAGMRWYLFQIQSDNLVLNHDDLMEHFQTTTPLKSHQVTLVMDNNSEILKANTQTWREKKRCTQTEINLSLNEQVLLTKQQLMEFQVTFVPKHIQSFNQHNKNYLLLSNEKEMALYSGIGVEEWRYSFPSNLSAGSPQLIDLENDGTFELACFMERDFNVVNTSNGKAVPRLSKKLQQKSGGGVCLNYDNKYDYRFLVTQGGKVNCYNETGAIVTGWKFAGSTDGTALAASQSYYTQIAGKDYITFKSNGNTQYVLNRRGESRFGQTYKFELNNESNFVVGTDEATLRKLGYKNQYIQNFYLHDGKRDSLKLDKRVTAQSARWILVNQDAYLIIDEPDRVVVFNVFGYVEHEIIKPAGATQFLGAHTLSGFKYVFFDNSKNSLYLLDRSGKISLSTTTNTLQVYGISPTHFYTLDGQKIKEHKLN